MTNIVLSRGGIDFEIVQPQNLPEIGLVQALYTRLASYNATPFCRRCRTCAVKLSVPTRRIQLT